MLWADPSCPRTLGELTYHKEVAEVLKFVAKKSDFSHMIFHGPSGAEKKKKSLMLRCRNIWYRSVQSPKRVKSSKSR